MTAAFEALLVPTLLAPVVASLGPLGAVLSDSIARTLVADATPERPT